MRVRACSSLRAQFAAAHAPRSQPRLYPPPPTSYEPRYAHFKREVLGSAAAPNALAIGGGHGRASSFEVTIVRGSAPPKLVYSKLSTGRFPDFDALARQITSGAV